MVSPKGKDLRLESDKDAILRGAEGILTKGKEVVISARDNIDLRTVTPPQFIHVSVQKCLQCRQGKFPNFSDFVCTCGFNSLIALVNSKDLHISRTLDCDVLSLT